MLVDGAEGATGSDPSLEHAAAGFADYLSAQEDKKPRETQPTPPAKPEPTVSESEDEEAAAEAAESEDESASTDEESETANEEPESSSLDPNAKVRVVVDGQEVEVTLEEALKGYSREAAFTRKSQDLAAKRNAQEAEFQAVRSERAKYADLLVQLEQSLHVPEPDWDRIQAEAPDQFPALWARHQKQQSELQVVAEERARAQAAVQRDAGEAHQRYIVEEQSKLLTAIPEWKDSEKAKAEKAELVVFAEKAGFSREELAQVADHRAVLLLRKAMLYDKAQAKKPAIVARIEKVKTATPGPTAAAKKPVSDVTKARQRLAKTGRIEDAAEAMASLLGDM